MQELKNKIPSKSQRVMAKLMELTQIKGLWYFGLLVIISDCMIWEEKS